MKTLLTLLQFFLFFQLIAQHPADYYVAVNGDDNNPGTFTQPWGTWQKAFSNAQAGDTVYFRGGTYYPLAVLPATNSAVYHSPVQQPVVGYNGTATERICFFNYPGETPILDCSLLDTVGRNFNGAISLMNSHFLHLKGLHVTNVYQPTSGELASGIGASWSSNIIFENLEVSNVGGRGMSFWGLAGNSTTPEIPFDTTKYINCDVFNCIDSLSSVPGNGSDAWKLDNEDAGYLYFYGCRAWNCGDDGFDISGPGLTIFEHCWSFDHHYPEALDGNGFKFGGNRGKDAYIDGNGQVVLGTQVPGVRKILKNCISANNIGLGYFDLGYAPYYPNNVRFYNNVSYNNGIGISMSINETYSGQNQGVYKNNIIYATQENDAAGRPYNLSVTEYYIESHNTWDFADTSVVGSIPWWIPTDTVTVTDDDFVSLDAAQLSLPRKPDGSLPDITFMRLAEGSDLIDAGTDVGTPFIGSAPDIGYHEYDPSSKTDKTNVQQNNQFTCFPNPTKDKITISYYSNSNEQIDIKIYDVLGKLLINQNSKDLNKYSIDLSTFPRGIYHLILSNGEQLTSTKIIKL